MTPRTKNNVTNLELDGDISIKLCIDIDSQRLEELLTIAPGFADDGTY